MSHFQPRTATTKKKRIKADGSQQYKSHRVPCPDCGESVKLKNLKSHQKKKCPKRFDQRIVARKVVVTTATARREPVRQTIPVPAGRPYYSQREYRL